VQSIKALGKRVGVAINPATPATVLEEIRQDLDQVLVMMVNPGFGHQHFLHTTLPKIRRARQMINRINPRCGLEVDGGVDVTTTLGWERYVGRSGGVIGMKTFGASAPLKELQRKFGFEPERVTEIAKDLLGKGKKS
jgi:pentose-5-phosphate-3-epimerase